MNTTFAESNIYYHQVTIPEIPCYNLGGKSILQGAVDPEQLRKALDLLIEGSEFAKVQFIEQSGQVVRSIVNGIKPELKVIDDFERVPTKADAFLRQEIQIPFQLAKAPLCRFYLIKITEEEYWLTIIWHHLLMDGYGVQVYLERLADIYTQLGKGIARDVINWKNPIQLEEIGKDEKKYRESEQFKRSEEYWNQKFPTRPEPLFPLRYPTMERTSGQILEKVSAEEFLEIKQLSAAYGSTPLQFFLALFSLYFGRAFNQDEFVIGLPVHNRRNAKLKKSICLLAGVTPAKIPVDHTMPFHELMREIGNIQKQDYRHQRYPISELNRKLKVQQSGQEQLFDLSFSYIRVEGNFRFDNIRHRSEQFTNGYEQTPLMIYLREFHEGEDVVLDFQYNHRYLSDREGERIVRQILHLLKTVRHTPELPINQFNLFPDTERSLQEQWHGKTIPFSKERWFHEQFEEQVKETPDRVALRFEDKQLTYRQLNEEANQLAHYLKEKDVKPNRPVAIRMNRSLELVITILGTLKAGAPYVPIDPNYPTSRLNHILRDSKSSLLLTQEKLRQEIREENLSIESFSLDSGIMKEQLSSYSVENIKRSSFGEEQPELAYLIYTSGTTGNPKGVMVGHKSLMNLYEGMKQYLNQMELKENYQWFWNASYGFDASLQGLIQLGSGATLHIPTEAMRMEPEEILLYFQYNGIDLYDSTPGQLELLFSEMELNRIGLELPNIFMGGEAVSTALWKKITDYSQQTGKKIFNAYGPTECTVNSTMALVGASDVPNIGQPLPNTTCYVLDSELRQCPVGVMGELHIGGECLAKGYWERQELTDEKFINNPFGKRGEEIIYKSGDLVRWLDDGTLEYIGRIDHQVKIRGFRIELGEIESRILENEQVKEAVVLAVTNDSEEKQLVAYTVLKESLEQNEWIKSIRKSLRSTLPDYMIPAVFIFLETMPLNVNGKIDRKGLPKPGFSDRKKSSFEAPRNKTEEQLCEILQTTLRLEKVGIQDNFFSIGGDSILSIQVVSAAKRQGLHFTTRQVFEYQTVALLAPHVKQEEATAISQKTVTGSMVLLPIQRLFFEEHDDPKHFNQSMLLRVPKGFTAQTLKAMVMVLYQRHDALRLRFCQQDGEWIGEHQPFSAQLLSETVSSELLTEMDDQNPDKLLEQKKSEIQRSLTPSGPLFRAVLFECGKKKEGRLLLAIHHLVIDGVSWRILLQDLETLYKQYQSGNKLTLPPKTSAYALWGARLVEESNAEWLQKEAEYWRAITTTPVDPIPMDHPDISDNSHTTTDTVNVLLNAEKTKVLLNQSNGAYHTQINDLLLAALLKGFYDWSGIRIMRVDQEGHGREEIFSDIDLNQTIGWFTTLYPILLRVDEPENLDRLIKTIKESNRAIPNNGIGYGMLRYLALDRSVVSSIDECQPTVCFNYLGQFDPAGEEAGAFSIADESVGELINPNRRRSHTLGFNGMVVNGQLGFAIDYNQKQYDRKTVETLGRAFEQALESIIDHCQNRDIAAFTPSDFPLATADQAMLETLQQRYPDMVDLYETTSMQKGMVYHSMVEETENSYLVQVCLTLTGPLNWKLFQTAWDQLVTNHDIFRTALINRSTEAPLQLVLKEANLPFLYEDWRNLTDEERTRQLEKRITEDQSLEFDFDQPPLMRFSLFQTADESFELIWTNHHTILDGWSLPIVFDEVRQRYNTLVTGKEFEGGKVPKYRDYIQWLKAQSNDAGIRFWQEELIEHTAPTPLIVDTLLPENREPGSGKLKRLLSEKVSKSLQTMAGNCAVTMNILLQTAWSILLHRYSGENQILFGTTVSGRPAALTDAESMVGLFINTIPVSVHIDKNLTIREFLQELLAAQNRREEFSWVPLVDIGRCSAIRNDVNLFDSLLIYENYPLGDDKEAGENGFNIENVRIQDGTNYKLTLVASLAEQLNVELGYHKSDFSEETIQRLLGHFENLLLILSGADSDKPLATIIEEASGNPVQLRKALAMPSGEEPVISEALGVPETGMEVELLAIWKEVLKQEAIGVTDNFFELGGHSLLAISLISKVRQTFSVEIAVRTVFSKPTIRELAKEIRNCPQKTTAPTIRRVSRNQELPLSFAQQRLWFLDQLEGGGATYNIPVAFRLTGPLDHEALEKGLNEIVQRHESLRTVFTDKNGKALQKILTDSRFQLRSIDLSDLSKGEREDKLETLIFEEASRAFDLTVDLMIRAQLIQLDEEDHVLSFTMHHIASDGWSVGILSHELRQLYLAFRNGEPSPLSSLKIQYADYSYWQRKWLEKGQLQKELDYWKKRLEGIPTIHNLPTDRPRPTRMDFKGDIIGRQLGHDLSDGLNLLARKHGVTLFMILQAAYALLLSRYSGEDDIVMGSPIAGRTVSEIAPLIGFFVNTLVFRVELADNPTFSELLDQVRMNTLEAYEHQQLPFEQLVNHLKPERSTAHTPIFQVMLTCQNNERAVLDLSDIKADMIDLSHTVAKFDLSVSCEENEKGLHMAWEYATALFDPETVERMMDHFEVLLTSIIENCDQPVASLPILPEQEQQLLLVDWSGDRFDYPKECSIQELFEKQACETPQAIALQWKEQQWTYEELNREANRWAFLLIEHGVEQEQFVAVSMDRCPDMIIALLAILKAGAAYIPLDRNDPVERRNELLKECGAGVLLTHSGFTEELDLIRKIVFQFDDPALRKRLDGYLTENPDRELLKTSDKIPAYINFTSGSTGKAKGVVVPQRAVVRLVCGNDFVPLNEETRILQCAPIVFDAATFEIWGALLNGGVLVLYPERLLDFCELTEEISTRQINTIWLTSALFDQWVTTLQPGETGLRYLLTGGDVVSKQTVEKLYQLDKSVTIINGYGPTENTTFSTTFSISGKLPAGESLPIGNPIAQSSAYVLDRQLQPVPIGVIGELFVGGDGLAMGYLNQPTLTTEKFIQNPFSSDPDERLYRTGDFVRWLPDGNLEFHGRMDQQVKIRGFRIEPEEIRTQLLRDSTMLDATVLVHDGLGEEKVLVAWVVPAEEVDEQQWTDQLKESLKISLPEYMIPSLFVVLDQIPVTRNGKVDRKALPLPTVSWEAMSEIEVADTGMEGRVLAIWKDVLNRDSIGVTDNFFELGGHSLMAASVVSKIRQLLSVELGVHTIFAKPTIRELAEELEKNDLQSKFPQITCAEDRHSLPLSFAQQRLWFLDQLEGGGATYNMPIALRLEGALDDQALERALSEIVRRHESLRTVFVNQGENSVRQVITNQEFQLERFDFSELPDEEQDRQIKAFATTEANRHFDLTSDLMIRGTLIIVDEKDHVLLVTMHHIASDGWSVTVLGNELNELYQAFHEKREPRLPVVEFQYGDYSHWQHNWLQGELLEKELGYWESKLKGIPEVHSLPTDRLRPARMDYQGEQLAQFIDPEMTNSLRTLAKKQGVTLFMLTHAALSLLLSRYGREEDILIGVPTAGRMVSELDSLIGFFVNTLVLRVDLSGDPTFTELLDQVRMTTLEAYEHQYVPFEKLVDHLQPKRSNAHTPIFQVMHAFQNNKQARLELPDIKLSNVSKTQKTARFDLLLNCEESDQGMLWTWEYSSTLFDRETIQRMSGHLKTLLQSILESPTWKISKLSMLPESERVQLLEWQGKNRTLPLPAGAVQELFEAKVAEVPDNIALTFGTEQLTYAELNVRANRLAHYLRTQGVGPDIPVALCLKRSFDMVIAILATLKAGGVYVPLDPDYPRKRLLFMLNNSEAQILLTTTELNELLPHTGQTMITLDDELITQSLLACSDQNIPVEELELRSNHLAYIIHTSGSTGQPKGVMMGHAPLLSLLSSQGEQCGMLKEPLTTLQFTSLNFDVSFQEIFTALTTGGRLVLISEEQRIDMRTLRQIMGEQKVERLFMPFAVLQVFAQTCLFQEDDLQTDLKELKLVITAGEQLQSTTELTRFFNQLKQCRLLNHYGPSETHVVTAWTLPESVENWPKLPPIGYPLPNAQPLVLSPTMEPVPIGVPGELYIGGGVLARGYQNRPDLTEERFGNRSYKTGDLVRWLSNGSLEFLGRVDQQVKIRGFRVELGEIEARLSELPSISEAAVIVWEEGQGWKELAAYLVLANDEEMKNGTESIRHELKELLPDYMIPAVFIQLDTMPLNPNGKIDRNALARIDDISAKMHKPERAKTTMEALLLQLWQKLLKRQDIGVDDNFFFIGGHSLLATTLVAKIQYELGIELPLRTLFSFPTIRELAARIEQDEWKQVNEEIAPVPREQDIPLSFAQQRLWFIDRFEPDKASYNMPLALMLKGPLNRVALNRAIDEILQRHESLRTVFIDNGEKTVQRILENAHIRLTERNLSRLSEQERLEKARTIAETEATQPFKLKEDPMIRGQLLILEEECHLLLLTIHHIAFDGWSIALFGRELDLLYRAYCQGKPSPLSPLDIQYADYAVWQRKWMSGSRLAREVQYWQEKLAGIPAVHSLSTDRPRPTRPDYKGDTVSLLLPIDIQNKLITLGQQQEATLFMVLQSAFSILLSRYGRESDILIGTPVAGRVKEELTPLIGFFVNTLVLRTDLSEDLTFEELLSQVKQNLLEAYEHQQLPFELLVEKLQPTRSTSYTPIFQIMLALQNNEQAELNLDGIELETFGELPAVSKFDLSLHCTETDQGLVMNWEYATALFDRETIERMAQSMEILLCAIPEKVTEPVYRLPLLDKADRERMLVSWNQTRSDYPKDRLFHELFEEQVEKSPDSAALLFGGMRITYGELNRYANRLAHFLISKGVREESMVGICLERSFGMVISILAILKAGGAYLPLDPTYPIDRLRFMLNDSEAAFLLVDALEEDDEDEEEESLATGREVFQWRDHRFQHEVFLQSTENPVLESMLPKSERLAYVIYTSGSTGKPKGVLSRHGGLVNLACGLRDAFDINEKSAHLQFASINFDASVYEITTTLISGGTLCLIEEETAKVPEKLASTIKTYGITHVHLPPVVLPLLENYRDSFSGVSSLCVGGEACPDDLARIWSKGRTFHNAYGPTECSVASTVFEYDGTGRLYLGKPLGNYQCYVLDTHMQPVPVGVPGELHIGGDGLARGYLKRPGLTREKFVTNPFAQNRKERLYKTGDLVRWTPDGNLEFLGRIDFQVKLRGFRIELGEIENCLACYEPIEDQVVVVHGSDEMEKQLIAYVVFKDQWEVSEVIHHVKSKLRQELPDFMIPAQFIPLASMPMTPNRKVDRRALPDPKLSGTVDSVHVPPRNATEIRLVAIWQEILKREQIGITHDFFDHGGHSLLAVRLINRIREIWNISLPIRKLFENPTIRELAVMIDNSHGNDSEVKQVDWKNELHALPEPLQTQDSMELEEAVDGQRNEKIKTVLLTGATGFVGAFLLRELMVRLRTCSVYCLVRAETNKEVLGRVRDNMKRYGLWKDEYMARIIPAPGDLSIPGLGLEQSLKREIEQNVDWILHNGAFVNHVMPYSSLKNANVIGTAELVRMASGERKVNFGYVSTTAIFSNGNGEEIVDEETTTSNEVHFDEGGYAVSKWIAERLINKGQKQGRSFHIYRLGRVTADSKTGVANPDDAIGRYLRSCRDLGGYPDMPIYESMAPVDIVAETIVSHGLSNPEQPEVLHLNGKQLVDWNEILLSDQENNYNRLLPANWLELVEQRSNTENPLPITPYLLSFKQSLSEQGDASGFTVDQQKTEQKMNKLGIKYPNLESGFWKSYMDQLPED